MSTLYREFTLTGATVWHNLVQLIKANARAFIEMGKPLRVIVTSSEKKRTSEQNAFYWAAVLPQISEQVWVDGRRFEVKVWHEHVAGMFCPHDEFTMPDGSKKLVRKSTTELKVGEFSTYLNQVQAYAASELGVRFEVQP